MNTPTPRQRMARIAGYAGWIGLIVLQPLWHAWLVPNPHDPLGAVLLLALLPLLLPLLAVRRPGRALLWAGIVALFYFCHGVAEAWAIPAERVPAVLEIILSLMLILSLGIGVQRRKPA
ncbi:DUF2069 domain-containing protein [Oleiagrimonas sp.]|jgi:uncharacterized membrane protein|uniref:DUF2069 domain-containing protein n=1 Tax=Oleiagrimonas sp. TaxID=2010330 RepID=UPI002619A5F6|nr:DUF2069 domain-containing protein [Oleiagrimonas sp.]MDA3914615.1 DUF2069 domain-containing protein [Oleiagrimonas sp.]